MATSKIAKNITQSPIVKELQLSYTVAANSTYNTNIKTLIDNNMPANHHFGGICGFVSNNVQVITINCGYYDSNYSLQLANRSGSAIGSTLYRIFYIAIPD